MQGICDPTEGLLAQPVRSLLKSWDWNTQQITSFAGLLGLPWAIKPLYGLLTDFVPIAGYRRKVYLVCASGATAACLIALAVYLPSSDDARWLFWLLLAGCVGVTFSDVVVDALMVETAQPRGLTGRFQAVQWGALYGAGILTATLGGYLSQHHRQRAGFVIVGSMALVTTLLAYFAVREERLPAHGGQGPRRSAPLGSAVQSLSEALRTPGILAVGGFLFLWTFNPFSSAVLYMHMTSVMKFNEQFFGNTEALSSVAQMIASVAYGFYCRRLKTATLIHLSIFLGVVSTLGYWGMTGHRSALIVGMGVGFTSATAVMIQLDLAARICPPRTAGTVFALLMALSNMGVSASTVLGGYWYDAWSRQFGHVAAFNLLVGVGATFTAACWLLMPALKRALCEGDRVTSPSRLR